MLGCLMEKAVTTPDNYPLSVNALINACNQTTNRDPIVTYDEATVEAALESLREKGCRRRVRATGQRVVKHRHVVDETLQLTVPEFTVLGVLLLRGAQTPGELKQRTERWHSFRSLDDIEADACSGWRERGFVHQLARRPGQKESRWVDAHRRARRSRRAPRRAAAPVGHRVRRTAPGATTTPAPAAAPRARARRGRARAALARGAQSGDGRAHPQRRGHRRRARSSRRSSGPGARSPHGRRAPYDERAAVVRAFRDLLEAEAEECARITTREMGKPIAQARNEVRGRPRTHRLEPRARRRRDRAARR